MKLGAAPEIDRHTLQLSEPCRRATMATTLRITSSHAHEPPSQAAQVSLLMRYSHSAQHDQEAAYLCQKCSPVIPHSFLAPCPLTRLLASHICDGNQT